MMWTENEVDLWCLTVRAYRKDSKTKFDLAKWRARRHNVREEILLYLDSFLKGQCSLQEFNSVFQQQKHYGWNVLGMRGTPGVTFLNKLTSYAPQDERLTQQLRDALPVPKDTQKGVYWMFQLGLFLEEMIAKRQVCRSQLHSGYSLE